MKKAICLLLFILTWSGMFSQCHYYFRSPNFTGMLPFSKLELQIIKDRKINLIEIVLEREFRELYHFNENGQLVLEEHLGKVKKKENIYQTRIYKYNKNNQLVVKHSNYMSQEINYDSLHYDAKGLIDYYYNEDIYVGENKDTSKHKNIYYLDTLSTGVRILSDTSNKIMYTLNSENEVIKIQSPDRIDSILIRNIDDINYIEEYWYYDSKIKDYKLGLEAVYKNKLIQQMKIYECMARDRYSEYFYAYDTQNFLVSEKYKEDNYRSDYYQENYFFTYEDSMPSSIIHKVGWNNELKITIFKYTYFK